MSRIHKLLVFYAAVIVGLFDIQSVASRFFERMPDPISWPKVFVAVAMQLTALLFWASFLSWLSAKGRSFVDAKSPFSWRRFGMAPAIFAAVIAAFSVTVLHNGWNCGNHPIPTSRGMTTCPG
jgi:hypothetical protein